MTETGLSARLPGVTVKIVDECASTNTWLKDRASALPENYVLIARRQTGGRGRTGRSFFSPEATGLYMSVLLRPALPPSDLPLITPAAAVAVSGAIEAELGVPASIKWVNDVYARGKKVCGILTESALDPSGAPSHAVLGIGVNLCPPEGGFPPEIANTAGAVLDRFDPTAPERLAAAILRRFFALYPHLPDRTFAAEYRARSFLIGRDITVYRGHDIRPARVLDTDRNCGLTVRWEDGAIETLTSGEVTVREGGTP